MDDLGFDPERFEYRKERTLGGDVMYVRIGCFHRHTEPVRSLVTGEPVGAICLDCSQQL